MKKIIVGIFLFLSYNVLAGGFNPDNMIITTKLSETFYDKNGDVLTGKGVVVGDINSGVDIFTQCSSSLMAEIMIGLM